MKSLTAVIYDTDCHVLANRALETCLQNFKFDEVLIFSDQQEPWGNKKVTMVDTIVQKGQYDNFVLNQLPDHVRTTHFLIVQFDGFIINPDQWSELFWHYDYIGAPWPQHNHGPMNVGNGGFCLRSKKLADAVKSFNYSFDAAGIHEDLYVCQKLRPILETRFNCHFPHESIASHFSAESYMYRYPTFGFHNIRFMPLVYQNQLDFLLDNLSDRVIRAHGNLMIPYMQQISKLHTEKLQQRINQLA